MNIVADCILDWQDMEGTTDLIKKINSLLTSSFIGRHDVPSDECESDAEILVTFFHADDNWQELIRGYLIFHYASDRNGSRMGDALYQTCSIVVNRMEQLIKLGRWPDQPIMVN